MLRSCCCHHSCRAYDVDAWRKLWDMSREVLQQVVGQQVPDLPATGTLTI